MKTKTFNFRFHCILILVATLIANCTPESDSVRRVGGQTPPKTQTPQGTPQTKTCPQGSEPAAVDLRDCCVEKKWGDSCKGNCWAEGVGEKLRKICMGTKDTTNDCGQSPAKTNTAQWCAFHYNRRYCGISDTDWLEYCKKTNSTETQPTGSATKISDCGQSPDKTKTKEWCQFHYNRRYCGITDAQWVQTCTSSPTAKP